MLCDRSTSVLCKSPENSPYTLQEVTAKLVPSTSIITDAKERHAVLLHLAQLYGVKRIQGFPGGHPTTVTRADLKRVHTERCMISLKSDGVRYLMLMCTIKGGFRAIMIDRCLRMYEVLIYAAEDFFDHRTLLDGELVLDHRTNSLCYQVFDVVVMKGHLYHDTPYCDRLQAIHNRVLSGLPRGMHEDSEEAEQFLIEEDKVYASRSNNMCLTMTPKRFVTITNARQLWNNRNTYSFANDGLLISFDCSPIRTGTLRTILKWKPHNAIDLLVDTTTLSLRCRNAGNEHPFDRLPFRGTTYPVVLQDNHLVQWLLHRKKSQSTWLVECLVELKRMDGELCAVVWPMKERSDKTEANDLRVIQSTLETILERIGLDELLPPPSDLSSNPEPYTASTSGTHTHETADSKEVATEPKSVKSVSSSEDHQLLAQRRARNAGRIRTRAQTSGAQRTPATSPRGVIKGKQRCRGSSAAEDNR